MKLARIGKSIALGLSLLLICPLAQAQKGAWRQASDAELASLLPARASVEREHIETEMRTASGIVNGHGHFIAGVVLITAGYSANGKYSHYLIVQARLRIGGVALNARRVCCSAGIAPASPLSASTLTGRHGRAGRHHRGTPHCRLQPCGKPAHLASQRQDADPDWALRDSLRVGRRIRNGNQREFVDNLAEEGSNHAKSSPAAARDSRAAMRCDSRRRGRFFAQRSFFRKQK